MSEDWKKTERYIKFLEEREKEWLERGEEYRKRIDFSKGVALGLFYGIIGNFAVQFFYPVFEKLMLGKLDLLLADFIIFAFTFAIILYVTFKFYHQLKEDERMMRVSKENVEIAKIAVERLERWMERLKYEEDKKKGS